MSQSWFNTNTSANDYFYTGDNAVFTDSPGTATTVNISGTVLPGNVTVSNTNINYTFSGTGSIGGGVTLQMNGPGVLTINNTNTYTGGTVLSGGLLNLGNANALGTGALTVTGGTIDNTSLAAMTLACGAQNWNGSFTFVGSKPLSTGTAAIALNNAPTVTVSAGTLTVPGVISGSGPLTVSGSGLLLSTAANTYFGGTTVSSGTFQLGTGLAGQDGSLAAGGVTINAGATMVYNLNGNQNITTFTFAGAGSLIKLGTGTLELSTNSSTGLTGTTSVNAGILEFNVGGGNGCLLNSPIFVSSAGTLQLNATDSLGYNSASTPVTIYGMMVKTNAQSETVVRPITLSGGTMNATAAAGGATPQDGSWDLFGAGATISTATGTTNFISGSGTAEDVSIRNGLSYFNIGANSTLTVGVPILQNHNSGSSPNCNITGPGTMIFAGNNFYGTAGTNAYVTSGTATVINVGYSSLAGNLLLAGSQTFPITTATTDSSAPADRNDGYFNVGFGSTLTISSSANVNVLGDLKLGTSASGSSGTANQTGGTLAVTGVDTTNGSRSLVIGEYPNETSAYNLSAGSLNVPNGLTFLGYSGSGVLNISGGTAMLLGIDFGAGQGGALNLSGNGLLSIGSSGISNNNANSSATISGGTLQTNASWNTTLPITLIGPANVGLQGNTVGLNGAISGSGSLALVGTGGTLLLGGSNSYTGGTTIPAGFIVRAGANNALGTGTLYLNGGGVSSNGASAYTFASPLVLSGGTLGDATNNGGLTFTATSGTLATNANLTVNSPVTINGNLTDGGSGYFLNKNGPGTLTLAGNNTFSGSMAAGAGKLYINGTNAATSIYVAPGATLGGSGTAASAAVTIDSGASPITGGNIDMSQNVGSTLTFASLTFSNYANITLPVLSNTATLALQGGAVTTNGGQSAVQFALADAELDCQRHISAVGL